MKTGSRLALLLNECDCDGAGNNEWIGEDYGDGAHGQDIGAFVIYDGVYNHAFLLVNLETGMVVESDVNLLVGNGGFKYQLIDPPHDGSGNALLGRS